MTSCSDDAADTNSSAEASGAAASTSGATGGSSSGSQSSLTVSGATGTANQLGTSGLSGVPAIGPSGFAVVKTERSISDPQPGAVPQGAEDLKVGDCYDPTPDPAQRTIIVLLVPCSGPHKYEVYANTFIDAGPLSGYPGETDVRNFAEERCYELFRPFVGIKWNASELDIETWYPTPGSWFRERDRQVSCSLFDRKLKDLIGSAQNAQQ